MSNDTVHRSVYTPAAAARAAPGRGARGSWPLPTGSD